MVLTDPQQINGYAYANNTPVSYSDPAGTCAGPDCPSRPCPVCENTTPGHEPGPIRLSANAKAAGMKLSDVLHHTSTHHPSKAESHAASAKRRAIAAAEELGKIIADELGITDAL